MEYTSENQQSLDIDWFAVDKKGRVIHFASGGGVLPTSISKNVDDNNKVTKYILSLNDINDDLDINNNALIILGLISQHEKDKYLNSFMKFAKKGVFSVDKTILNNHQDKNYHLVASPHHYLEINNFPELIKRMLLKTIYNGDITNTLRLSLSEVISM